MTVKITYPAAGKRRSAARKLREWIKWSFLFAGFICPVINLAVGGRAWSPVVMWSLWLVWTQLVSPDMVEYNRISQLIKLVVNSCVLLAMIGAFLSPGWAVEVVSIVCFAALAVVGVLFFTDIDRQKQNMFPMLFLCAACLAGAVTELCLIRGESRWAPAVMGAFALCLLVGCAARLGGELPRELKKRFSSK